VHSKKICKKAKKRMHGGQKPSEKKYPPLTEEHAPMSRFGYAPVLQGY